MSMKATPVEQILPPLAGAPSQIFAITSRFTSAQLRISPGPDEWSANDVLAHLRSCADVWGGCIRTIVTEDTPTIRAINPRSWIKRTNYRDLDFAASLRAFATQRAELMAFLEHLPVEAWSRKAIVTGAGNVLERTVESYAQRLVRHERPHIKQIEGIVSSIEV
jgi:DinB family protein